MTPPDRGEPREVSDKRWDFQTTFRIAVERRYGTGRWSWWRRFQWSVERLPYKHGDDWRWVAGGRAFTGHRAWARAHRSALWYSRFNEGGGTDRIEVKVVRKYSCAPIPDKPPWAKPVDMEIL